MCVCDVCVCVCVCVRVYGVCVCVCVCVVCVCERIKKNAVRLSLVPSKKKCRSAGFEYLHFAVLFGWHCLELVSHPLTQLSLQSRIRVF